MNTATQDCDSDALKASARGPQRTTRVSPVEWTINARYGLGRDQSQFIVYRAKTPKSGKPQPASETHKAVAFFTSLEAALLWIVMRQAHFDDEPTLPEDILDAFQRYCHHLDRVKTDITVLAKRLETAIKRQGS